MEWWKRRNGSRGKARLKDECGNIWYVRMVRKEGRFDIRPSTKVLTCVNRRVSGGATERLFRCNVTLFRSGVGNVTTHSRLRTVTAFF